MILNFIFIGNAGFWFGRSGYFDDGDEDNNYENGSADDDGEIDEDRKCMAVMTDIAWQFMTEKVLITWWHNESSFGHQGTRSLLNFLKSSFQPL